MRIGEARALKAEILSNLYRQDANTSKLPQSFAAEFAGYRRKKHRKMLSVGYSKQGDEDYCIELRVRSPRGFAADLARNIKDAIGDDVNVGILSRISIPSEETAEIENNGDDCGIWQFLRTRHSPLQLGSSIGNVEGKSGTIGGFFLDDDDDHFVLSCNHVLALCNTAPTGSVIYNPGPSDIRPMRMNKVGELARYVADLTVSSPNGSDSALARVVVDDTGHPGVTGNVVPPQLPHAGRPIVPMQDDYPRQGTIVEKVGRTTGYTKGTVYAVSLDDVEVEYEFVVDGVPQTKIFVFNNVVQIRSSDRKKPFSIFGDSGSLVFSEIGDSIFGIGIVFAGAHYYDDGSSTSEPVTLCCTLKDIIEQYPDLRWMGEEA